MTGLMFRPLLPVLFTHWALRSCTDAQGRLWKRAGERPLTRLNPARRNAIAERPRASAVNQSPAKIQLLVVFMTIPLLSVVARCSRQREFAGQEVTDRNTRCEGARKARVRPVPATQLLARARDDAAPDRWCQQLLRSNGAFNAREVANSRNLPVSLRVSAAWKRKSGPPESARKFSKPAAHSSRA